MKSLLAAFLGVCVAACATVKTDPVSVKVYEANASAPAESRRMPAGCNLIDTTAPFDQMESERYVENPYRRQREATAAKGGNALLVLSSRIVTRPGLECPPSDRSPNCLRDSQSWNRVSFESYTCSPEALATLAAIPVPAEGGWLTIPLTKKPAAPVLTAQELKSKILAMMRNAVGTDVIVTYVQGQRLKAKLTAEDIIEWKRESVAEEVILAAAAK
jgi:hypothetical protein